MTLDEKIIELKEEIIEGVQKCRRRYSEKISRGESSGIGHLRISKLMMLTKF